MDSAQLFMRRDQDQAFVTSNRLTLVQNAARKFVEGLIEHLKSFVIVRFPKLAEYAMFAVVYRGLGIGLVGLAAIGVFLPLLPSTPFLLLATGCFMRSSPQWNERLFRSPLFGQCLRDWNTNGTVSPTTKAIAIGTMTLVGLMTLVNGGMPWGVSAGLVITMIAASVIVIRLPSGSRQGTPV